MPAGNDFVYPLISGGMYHFNANGTKIDFVGGTSQILPTGFHDEVHAAGAVFTFTGSCKVGSDDENNFIRFAEDGSNTIRFFTNGVEDMRLDSGGNLHVDADVIGFSSTTSDIRLKTNIQPLAGSLDVICNLKGVTFDWKNKKRGLNQPGLIAQEVEQIIPQSINHHKLPYYAPKGDNTEYKTINYDMIVPHLIESIKELKTEIDNLKQQLENK